MKRKHKHTNYGFSKTTKPVTIKDIKRVIQFIKRISESTILNFNFDFLKNIK